jgi:hypothetical protein
MRNAVGRIVVAVLLSGCNNGPASTTESDHTCTADIVQGIWVHVNDRATLAPLVGVRGEVRSGTYVDSIQRSTDGVYTAAQEHPGTFTMHLEHTGYSPLDVNNIVVTAGVCHVKPTVLYVTMQATP